MVRVPLQKKVLPNMDLIQRVLTTGRIIGLDREFKPRTSVLVG